MAKKKHEEEHENHERWLVSYADFITLLFAFFVVMYSISRVDNKRMATGVQSLKFALHFQGTGGIDKMPILDAPPTRPADAFATMGRCPPRAAPLPPPMRRGPTAGTGNYGPAPAPARRAPSHQMPTPPPARPTAASRWSSPSNPTNLSSGRPAAL